jgi:photosystem II stability/assembly factor-like uncharacterized protein
MDRISLAQRACIALALSLYALAGGAADSDDLVFTPAPLQSEPTSQLLLDITAAGDRLVAVGASGLIITSDDQGSTWQQAAVPVSATLTAVSFPTPDEGWAVAHAGVVLHSSNAGNSWELQYDGKRGSRAFLEFASRRREELENNLAALESKESVTAADREELEYALDDALFIEEEAQLGVDTGPADPFLDVQFFDEQRGLAVGAYGMSFSTDDGGVNWTVNQIGLQNPDRFHLYNLHLDDADVVYAAGEAGLLFRSDDAGITFQRASDVYEGSLFGVLPLNNGVITFGLRGHLFVSEYQSGEWHERASQNQNSLYGGAALADGGVLLLGAGGTLLRLDSSGAERLYRHPSRSTFSSAFEASDGQIWLVGMDGIGRISEAQLQ